MKLHELQEARYAGRQQLDLADVERGDKIIITSRSRRGTERRSGIVRNVDLGDSIHSGILYAPHHREGMLTTGQGHLKPSDIGKGPYGIQHVEIIKRKRPRPIREAGYAGDHPIVAWINNFMHRARHLGAAASKKLGMAKEGQAAIIAITKAFGEPQPNIGGPEEEKMTSWQVEYDDGLYLVEVHMFVPNSDITGAYITKVI